MTERRFTRLFWVVLSALVCAACAVKNSSETPASAVMPVTRTLDWSSYGGAPAGGHFSGSAQINRSNVGRLEPIWQHRSGDWREQQDTATGELPQSSFQATPIVVEERLYYCTPFNHVIALDAASGAELWRFDPQVDRKQDFLAQCRGVSYWSSGESGRCEQRILSGTLDGRLLALDANSGQPCLEFGDRGQVDIASTVGSHAQAEYSITSPPAIIGDVLITGAMVLDNLRTDAPSGVVRAYSVRDGSLQWGWNPVAPGSPQRDENGHWRGGTTNVWSLISVDEQRQLVFVPTGNMSTDYFGGTRAGDDYYSSSLVALNAGDGSLAWHYQFVNHDVWDYDTPSQPTLVDLAVAGQQVPVVVQTTKMGLTFVLHRETGQPLWPVNEEPVPQAGVAGEQLAQTQRFPTHVPPMFDKSIGAEDAWGLTFWDRGRCRKRLAELDNEGWYTPPSLKGSLHYPPNSGGNNWGSPAIDPDTGVMVVYTSRVPASIQLRPRAECADSIQPQAGTPYCVVNEFVLSPLGMPCTAPPWGTLDAIDLVAGEHLWSVPLGTTRDLAPWPLWNFKGLPGMAAPLMTGGGLIFTGVLNEHAFRAFDRHSGEELWSWRLPTAAVALPMSYQLASTGKQYVVVAVGGHWSGGSPAGDTLMAFALGE